MNIIIIACETLKDEILLTAERANSSYPIVWIESGLHERPEKLNARLQEEINKVDGKYEYILLGYGYCGAALKGLVSHSSKIIIPKVEDCISIMLGGDEERSIVNNRDKPLFISRGWLNYINDMKGFRWSIEKYGYDMTLQIYRQIFDGYKHVDIIDTGAYKTSDCLKEAEEISNILNLKCKIIPGSLKILYNALNGIWDNDFAIIEPRQLVIAEILGRES